MSRYLDPQRLPRVSGALRLAGLAGVLAPAPHRGGHRPEWPGPVPGCGCRAEGPVVVLCEHHFAGLAGESR